MNALSQQRCFHHAGREAAARCPECRGFFCRECVTEHEDRVICSACLRRLSGSVERRGGGWRVALRLAQGLAGLAAAWLVFYLAGRALLLAPSSFHEGTVWKEIDWGEQARLPLVPMPRHLPP